MSKTALERLRDARFLLNRTERHYKTYPSESVANMIDHLNKYIYRISIDIDKSREHLIAFVKEYGQQKTYYLPLICYEIPNVPDYIYLNTLYINELLNYEHILKTAGVPFNLIKIDEGE
jgi:hypothetical protein